MTKAQRLALYVAELSGELDQVLDWVLDLRRQLGVVRRRAGLPRIHPRNRGHAARRKKR